MKVKCEYCGSEINDTDEKCPNCGADNKKFKRNASFIPKTINELKEWYIANNLPDETVTRFFIGKDYKEPRAFGIYQDLGTGKFIVYKNKADGSRAIRYEGNEEAYAVNELYIKLKEEIVNQKQNNLNRRNNQKSVTVGNALSFIWLALFFILFFGVMIFCNTSGSGGYYSYNDHYYYYQGGDWYGYNDRYGWERSYSVPYELEHNRKSYYRSRYYDSSYNVSDFKYSEYYEEPSSSSSSSDSSSSSYWDSSSSWDSSSTDWGSDW